MATNGKSNGRQTADNRSGKSTARWITGFVITMVGIYALASVLSYYFTWKSDFSILTSPKVNTEDIENLCGTWGGYLGYWLVGCSFGVFGVLAAVMVISTGIRILKRKMIIFNHGMLCCSLVLIFGSLTLGMLFGERWGMFGHGWGGAYGVFVAEWLRVRIGIAGAAILLVVGWILTGVLINRNFINTVNDAGNAMTSVYDRVRFFFSRRRETRAKEETVVPDGDITEDASSESEPSKETSSDDDFLKELDIDSLPELEPLPEPELLPEPEPLPEPESDGNEDDSEEQNGEESESGGSESIVVEQGVSRQVDKGDISTVYDPTEDLYNYKAPSPDLLKEHGADLHVSDEEIVYNKRKIEETLANFGIPIRDMKATAGPTVTLYEIVQEQGVKISKIQGLEDDIAQSLKALGIRIIAPMPGRGTIGIEVPNRDKEIVSMHSAVMSERFQRFKGELPVVIGRTIQNDNYVFDLTKMPHLLVAGATGQGKSVGLNAIIASLLFRKHPAELKFVLIDPKMVEFSLYAKLEKHFLAKMESEEDAIVTDPKKAVYTLNALCLEMDRRLDLCRKAGARNIVEYNEKFVNRRLNPENGHRFLPYIVVIVDEFADLIMTAREVEAPVMRLAQKARAIGIHLIIATQRPDVRVITGGIKANFPARIAFRVTQMIDSRTIIDQPGANQLIGRGDMLFSKDGDLTRIQCAFLDTPEVELIVDSIAQQHGYTSAYALPDYEEAGSGSDAAMGSSADLGGGAPVKYDSLFAEIARDAVTSGQISTSYIQRNYEVGFNRAGRIMTQLERAGIVGPQIGAKQREIKFYDLPSLEAKLQDLGIY